MAKFEVLHNAVTHEGRIYERGEIVDLDKDLGDRLASEYGALQPVVEKAQRRQAKTEESEPGKAEG
ncbi:hypothetical protein [Saccharopolyspora pogona]|uniref:hypothetical protein n=1 Tax=Saccharopolyspora pogona TaxID=333966 RepID=UPI001685E684|nr:hypothetical protein [Saccharopolyspora pogona]